MHQTLSKHIRREYQRHKDIKGNIFSKKRRCKIESCIQTREEESKRNGKSKENAQVKVRTKEMLDEDKETDEVGLSTEDEVSTAKKGVSSLEFEKKVKKNGAEAEKNKIAREEAANEALIKNFDDVQQAKPKEEVKEEDKDEERYRKRKQSVLRIQNNTTTEEAKSSDGDDHLNVITVNLRLESEEESTMALELIRFIKKNKELSIPEQTATGKGTSNPLMAGSLPKTIKPT
ncbi:hypothetical protein Tco_0093090 [Tanacetum coccineum]